MAINRKTRTRRIRNRAPRTRRRRSMRTRTRLRPSTNRRTSSRLRFRTVSPYRNTEARKSGEKSRLLRSRTSNATNATVTAAVTASTRRAFVRTAVFWPCRSAGYCSLAATPDKKAVVDRRLGSGKKHVLALHDMQRRSAPHPLPPPRWPCSPRGVSRPGRAAARARGRPPRHVRQPRAPRARPRAPARPGGPRQPARRQRGGGLHLRRRVAPRASAHVPRTGRPARVGRRAHQRAAHRSARCALRRQPLPARVGRRAVRDPAHHGRQGRAERAEPRRRLRWPGRAASPCSRLAWTGRGIALAPHRRFTGGIPLLRGPRAALVSAVAAAPAEFAGSPAAPATSPRGPHPQPRVRSDAARTDTGSPDPPLLLIPRARRPRAGAVALLPLRRRARPVFPTAGAGCRRALHLRVLRGAPPAPRAVAPG